MDARSLASEMGGGGSYNGETESPGPVNLIEMSLSYLDR
jgi:hypothetical protein